MRVLGVGAGGRLPKTLAGERVFCAPGVAGALLASPAEEDLAPAGSADVVLLFGGPEPSDPYLERAIAAGGTIEWGAPLAVELGLPPQTMSRPASDSLPWPAAQGVILYGDGGDKLPSTLEEAPDATLYERGTKETGPVLTLSKRRTASGFLYVPPLGGESALRLVGAQAVMARLRAPGGCPWDRDQTHASLLPYLLEEAAEVYDALQTGNVHETVEELGDLFLQVLFHAELGEEEGMYDVGAIAEGLRVKLRRRHPHVFGDEHYETAEAFVPRWDALKAEEGLRRDSELSGIPRSLSSLGALQKAIERLRRAGVADLSAQGFGADLAKRVFAGEDLEASARAEMARLRGLCSRTEAILGRKLSQATETDVQNAWNEAKMA